MTEQIPYFQPAQDLLVQALEDIIEPFAYIERTLPEGYRLDGQAALQQINSREFYTRIAKEALAAHRASIPAPEGEALVERISGYLSAGGLFNPELADHVVVRDLLIDCRAALAAQPTRSQRMRDAGYTRRPSWKSLPSDAEDEAVPAPAEGDGEAGPHDDAQYLAHRIERSLLEDSEPHVALHRGFLAAAARVLRASDVQPKGTVTNGLYDNVALGRRECWSNGRFQWSVSKGELAGRILLDGKPHPAWGHYPDLPAQAPAPAHKAIEWQPGPNLFKDWCAQWFGPDADDAYLARAVAAFPAGQPTMGELPTQIAIDKAKSAMGYSQSFDGKSIDWQNGEPWPHRIELAQALDWITDLGAVVLNLADRVVPPLVIQAPAVVAELPPLLVDALTKRNFRQATDIHDLCALAASVVREDGDVIAGLVAIKATIMAEHLIGRSARLRAAGMGGLLSEILGKGALSHYGDADLIERVEMAVADQEAAVFDVPVHPMGDANG